MNIRKLFIITALGGVFSTSCSDKIIKERNMKTRSLIICATSIAAGAFVTYKYFSKNTASDVSINKEKIDFNEIKIGEEDESINQNFPNSPIWKISGEGIKTSYISATVHFSDKEYIENYMKEMEKFFNKCEAYLTESNLFFYNKNSENIIKEIFETAIGIYMRDAINNPQNKDFEDFFKKANEEIKKLKKHFSFQYPNYAFNPSFVAACIGTENFVSPDIYFCQKANNKKLTVEELDVFISELGNFYSRLSWWIKPKFLRDFILTQLHFYKNMTIKMNLLENARFYNKFENYKEAQVYLLKKEVDQLLSIDNINDKYRRFHNDTESIAANVVERNKAWIPKILKLVKNKKTFITCGYKHIYDLLKKMEEKNIKIEKI